MAVLYIGLADGAPRGDMNLLAAVGLPTDWRITLVRLESGRRSMGPPTDPR